MIYDKKKHYVTCIGAACPIKHNCYLYINLGKILGSACVNPPYKTIRTETTCVLFENK